MARRRARGRRGESRRDRDRRQACAQISKVVASGAISGSLGAAGVVNVQDEEQKKLDIITNDILRDALNGCPLVAGLASEELEVIETTGAVGGFLVTFDPLDGSSNIDVNVSVGTIFSILPAPGRRRAQPRPTSCCPAASRSPPATRSTARRPCWC
jgi:fructose-1,6-bisphosphatase